MSDRTQPLVELIARAIHIGAGTACVCVAAWFLFLVAPFNPWGLGIFLVFGAGFLLTGLLGTRKDVLRLLLISGA